MNLAKKATFLTSSMGTKWQAYSQALLQINFPECKKILIDGSSGWDPLFFTKRLERIGTEYQVLVDEDCFILDRGQLVYLINLMDENHDISVISTPDGGTFHRDYNPIACNPFFAIIRQRALIKAISKQGWETLSYCDIEHFSEKNHVNKLDIKRISYEKSEPYYPFFWAVISSGGAIKYLVPSVQKDILASEITLDGFTQPLLIHMWWLRRWFDHGQDEYLKMPNIERYNRLENMILAPRFRGVREKIILLIKKIHRYICWVSRVFSGKNRA